MQLRKVGRWRQHKLESVARWRKAGLWRQKRADLSETSSTAGRCDKEEGVPAVGDQLKKEIDYASAVGDKDKVRFFKRIHS